MNNQSLKQSNNSVVSLGTFYSDKFTAALSDYGVGLHQNWHKHDDFILAMTLKGYVREQVGSRDELVKPLTIGVKSAEIRHTDHFWEKGVRVVKISLSPAFMNGLKSRSLIKEGWEWTTGSAATRPFLRVADQLLHHRSSETEVAEGIYEILGAISSVRRPYAAQQAPLWLRRSRENLAGSFAEGVRLTQLADEAGVHPVYFARQFRRFFGSSVGRYVRELQFEKATGLLESGQASLAEIAYRVGCSDQAHLSRIFLTEFGVTPGNFRKLVR